MVKDIYTGSTNSKLSTTASFTAIGNTLYFIARSGSTTDYELWKSDGTAAGTVLVKDIYPGTTSSNPANLLAIGNILYFSASDPTNGQELWKSDGTTSGTVMVKDIYV